MSLIITLEKRHSSFHSFNGRYGATMKSVRVVTPEQRATAMAAAQAAAAKAARLATVDAPSPVATRLSSGSAASVAYAVTSPTVEAAGPLVSSPAILPSAPLQPMGVALLSTDSAGAAPLLSGDVSSDSIGKLLRELKA